MLKTRSNTKKGSTEDAHCLSSSWISISLAFIWLGALFWAAAPLMGWGGYTDRGYGTCEVDWAKANSSTLIKSYIMSIFTFCFFLPVGVMIFCYASILNAVKKTNVMLANGGALTARQRKTERDVTIVSTVICTSFILAWSPYAVVSMWSACGQHVPNMTSIFTRLFAKSASFYNPLIYFGLSARFRRDVWVLMSCERGSRDAVERLGTHPDLGPPKPPLYVAEMRCMGAEYPKPSQGPDSGVGSRPQAPLPVTQKGSFIPASQCPKSPEFECTRL